MNEAVPLWNEGDVTISVDGTYVGVARCVRTEQSSRTLWLDGLDPLATLFFSALVGRAGESGTRVGALALDDRQAAHELRAEGSRLADFSSGTHHVALIADEIDIRASV